MVSMTIIQAEEYPPMPSASGRSSHSTCWSCSASQLTPRNSRLHTTPTTSAGTTSGSNVRAGVVSWGSACASVLTGTP